MKSILNASSEVSGSEFRRVFCALIGKENNKIKINKIDLKYKKLPTLFLLLVLIIFFIKII